MTQKELSYVEDAVMHEEAIIEICKETYNMLEEQELKEFIEEQINCHTKDKEQLINLLEGKSNE